MTRPLRQGYWRKVPDVRMVRPMVRLKVPGVAYLAPYEDLVEKP
jgi:hypothetical protein